jgi:hypothetical protein
MGSLKDISLLSMVFVRGILYPPTYFCCVLRVYLMSSKGGEGEFAERGLHL